MRWSVVFPIFLITFVGLLAAQEADAPRLKTVEPSTGKAGDVLTVGGENIEKKNVPELYLTDGSNDLKVEVIEQSASEIKFKIPSKAKPGRYSLMILTGGREPRLLEQPVKVTVE